MESSMRLFKEKGYDNVSIGEICKANEISKPTFYKYIPAKELVLVEYFQQVRQDAMEQARQYMAEDRPAAAIQKLLICMIEAALELGPNLYRIYWSYLLRQCAESDCRTSDLKHLVADAIARLQEKGEILSKGNPEKLAMVLLDVSEGFGISWAMLDGCFDPVEKYQASVREVLGVVVTPEKYQNAKLSAAC